MEKKLLLALDDSLHSKHALQYVVMMSSFMEDLKYTLFMVQPSISGFLLDEAQNDPKARKALERMRTRHEEKALARLDGFKTQMTDLGVPGDRIEVKTRAKKLGLARDILEEAEEGRYDAIAVGRRGIGKMQEMFMGSVTKNLVEHSRVIPIWVVDGEVTTTKLMIAVDGSESALRAVDHVAFMFARNASAKITLLHVVPKLKAYCGIDMDDAEAADLEDVVVAGDKRCVESFLVHAYNKFREAGIEKEQIEIRTVEKTRNVGKAIVEELEKGGYGTVVFGRRGLSKAFFMGSVSNYIIGKTEDRALWLVS